MRPRLGFLGVGWIGRARMESVISSSAAGVCAVADEAPEAAQSAARLSGATILEPEEMLAGVVPLDGIVIATPSALHAAQAGKALAAGMAVFCQKPLGRSAAECRAVLEAARQADRLLGVDFTYRHLRAVSRMRDVITSGAIGEVYAAELVFHNAYGPDKQWYSDIDLSGGGCLIDLGIHLVDLALWMLGGGEVSVDDVSGRLFAKGRPLPGGGEEVEDFAMARLDLSTGAAVHLACSWFLHAGLHAVIGATFHGTTGSVVLENVGGSFYDFRASHHTGTVSRSLAEPPDCWGGRAIVGWAEQLASDGSFNDEALKAVEVAAVIDRIYGR
jgi:predicted dehydrogenase